MNRDISLLATAILMPGDPVDVSFAPPPVRRRLSPLQRIFFTLANRLGPCANESIVFACRDGEDTLTRRIVADYAVDGSVSPHRFSTSVYNASPGLWSILTKNRSPYTAIAAGEDTIECGLIEALLGGQPATFVYAEETGGGYGAAARFAPDIHRERPLVLRHEASDASISFAALTDFLTGRSRELHGRWIGIRVES